MKLLLAIDGSAHSEAPVREVATRPWPRGTQVRVLSVVEPSPPPAYGPEVPFAVAAAPVELQRILQNEADALVAQVASSLADEGLQATSVVRSGDPKKVIVDEARVWGADLILVGSHGRTGLRRLFMGSVAESVLRHAPCSVEVVRSAGNLDQLADAQ